MGKALRQPRADRETRTSTGRLSESGLLSCINIVLYLNRLEGIAEHVHLDLTIGLRKPVMLPFVFGPRINFKALEIDTRCLCIDEDSPAYRAISAANALIFMDFTEKLGSFRRVDDIFQCDEDRPLFKVGLLNHGWFHPEIPDAEVYLRVGKLEQRPQQ
jgi:hypothetical protein